jgi:signal transduction histidine kinase
LNAEFVRLLVMLALLALAVAAALILLSRSRQLSRQLQQDRDSYLTELSAAEHEREVSTSQVEAALARVAASGQLLDALPLPVWRRRQSDLTLLDVNAAYAQAIDATKEAVLAEQAELAAGALGRDGRELAIRARDAGVSQRASRHVVVAGTRRLLEIAETPIPGKDEIVGYARDFTDLEAVQSELTRHTDSHVEVLERMAAPIAIYGPDTRLSFFNRAFSALWQLEPEWLATQPNIDELLERLREQRRLPESVDFRAFKRGVLALFTSLIDAHQELMHLPDDRTLRVAISPHPMGGLIFVYEDVTDRLLLERSVNTLTEVQRETLDQLKEAVAVFGTDGRLKLSNPAFAAVWKIAPDQLVGEPHIGEIVEKMRHFLDRGGDWPAQRRELVARLMTHRAQEERIERSDGSILQFAAVPLPDGNMLFLYLDVTATTRLAGALAERNAALVAADRLKSEFLANVSYELRTPLNSITGFAELLGNQYFGTLNERQLGYAAGILESGRGLMALINDIIDLATIEAGYLALELDDVDIHAMISSLHTLAHERARERRLTLKLDCAQGIGEARLDQRRIRQALFNLLSNAFKFTPSGGEVTLSAKRTATGIALGVSDTGPGVAPEDRGRIFDRFERGTMPSREAGAGLGLALVKSIVELHGGKVELDSVPGVGTAVTCYLPA